MAKNVHSFWDSQYSDVPELRLSMSAIRRGFRKQHVDPRFVSRQDREELAQDVFPRLLKYYPEQVASQDYRPIWKVGASVVADYLAQQSRHSPMTISDLSHHPIPASECHSYLFDFLYPQCTSPGVRLTLEALKEGVDPTPKAIASATGRTPAAVSRTFVKIRSMFLKRAHEKIDAVIWANSSRPDEDWQEPEILSWPTNVNHRMQLLVEVQQRIVLATEMQVQQRKPHSVRNLCCYSRSVIEATYGLFGPHRFIDEPFLTTETLLSQAHTLGCEFQICKTKPVESVNDIMRLPLTALAVTHVTQHIDSRQARIQKGRADHLVKWLTAVLGEYISPQEVHVLKEECFQGLADMIERGQRGETVAQIIAGINQ